MLNRVHDGNDMNLKGGLCTISKVKKTGENFLHVSVSECRPVPSPVCTILHMSNAVAILGLWLPLKMECYCHKNNLKNKRNYVFIITFLKMFFALLKPTLKHIY